LNKYCIVDVLHWALSPTTRNLFLWERRARLNEPQLVSSSTLLNSQDTTRIVTADTGIMSIWGSSWLFNRFSAVTWWAFIAIIGLGPALGLYKLLICKESGRFYSLWKSTLHTYTDLSIGVYTDIQPPSTHRNLGRSTVQRTLVDSDHK
jgi:hypothetical protein